jgi:ComF family protein
VPVPLHPSRRRRRGFNQAHELAAHLGPPVLPVLRRRRRTETQASLTAAARRTNVESAFATGRGHRWFGWNPVEAKRVVLVDDVWTTGATLMACARVLREAGAAEVRVVAVARTLPFREFSAPGAPGMPG